ncbi:MAG: acyltransferase [Microthrixaceae bacterium]
MTESPPMDPQISSRGSVESIPVNAPTPQGRDTLLDLVRASALLVVVLWHWIFTSVRWSDDGPHVGNPVAVTPGMWLLTWLLQIMPAFFIVGGALHSLDDSPTLEFWSKRFRRLLVPVLPLLIPATMALITFSLLGRHDLVRGVILIISPMWFLATYLVCAAMKPAAQWLHARFGPVAVLAGVVGALVVDRLRIGHGVGGPVTGLLAFVMVWATVHQLGFSLSALRSASRRTQLGVAVAGYGALGIAAWATPYPAAMVGLDGHKLSNMGPPTAMVVFLAVGQMGLLCLAAPSLERFALRNRSLLKTAGEWSMTVYAWHLVAYAIFWALAVSLGLRVSSTIDSQWWLQRPAWLLGPLLLAIPVCRLTRRFDGSLGRHRASS